MYDIINNSKSKDIDSKTKKYSYAFTHISEASLLVTCPFKSSVTFDLFANLRSMFRNEKMSKTLSAISAMLLS